MFCSRCGAQLSGSEMFCRACGNPVLTNSTSYPSQNQFAPTGNISLKSRKMLPKSGRVWSIILTVLSAIWGGACSFVGIGLFLTTPISLGNYSVAYAFLGLCGLAAFAIAVGFISIFRCRVSGCKVVLFSAVANLLFGIGFACFSGEPLEDVIATLIVFVIFAVLNVCMAWLYLRKKLRQCVVVESQGQMFAQPGISAAQPAINAMQPVTNFAQPANVIQPANVAQSPASAFAGGGVTVPSERNTTGFAAVNNTVAVEKGTKTKTVKRVLAGIAAVLCIISVFLPWFMHTNDDHPYTVLDMANLGDYFRIAWSQEDMFAAFIWVPVVVIIALALVMSLSAFLKKRVPLGLAISVPALAIIVLTGSSIMFWDWGFFPVYGPAVVFIATILYIISVFINPKPDSRKQ